MSDNLINPTGRMRYTRQSVITNTFYQMPRFLTAGAFAGSGISNDARVLYTLLLNRHKLSIKNDWVDENGEVFQYFTKEEMQKILGLSKMTVTKVMRELANLSLVEEKRQGLNKPNMIYILQPVIGDNEAAEPYLDHETGSNSDT